MAYVRDECGACHAAIIWASHEKTLRMIPVDYDPVDVNRGGGNIILTPRPGISPSARVVTNLAILFGVKIVYRSHFKTCPHARLHRRPRERSVN